MGSRLKSHVYWIPLGRSNVLLEVKFLASSMHLGPI